MNNKTIRWFEAAFENANDLIKGITALHDKSCVVQTIAVSSTAQYEDLKGLLAGVKAPVLIHGDGEKGRPRVPPGMMWLAAEKLEEVSDEQQIS